ncbi:unnamed protein product [Caenorhabditis auriculariae]|uniref:RGS domain-containing protein n=1 Tax=Caenorhabditis auriculariae TaxID=2777116 RepID=A0A8S1GRN7_9PELO|nr:unnamed protein product [Caenorhabditis auriculariae]
MKTGETTGASSAQDSTASCSNAYNVGDQGSSGYAVGETNTSREMKIFKKVLRDPVLRQPFQDFLEQQFCAENLNFYIAVEQFREQNFYTDDKIGERAVMARRIYERYFAQNSTEPVNIDNSTSKRIRETIDDGLFPRNTFDIAQYQILHLLKYDCWPRFLRAGGAQPDFTDDQLAEEEDRQRRIELGENVESTTFHRRSSGRALGRQSTSSISAASGTGPLTMRTASDKKKKTTSITTTRQHSLSHPNSPAPSGPRSNTARTQPVQLKFCRLVTGCGDASSAVNEIIIELSDPTQSVRAWTRQQAATVGMDVRNTQVVDAETGTSIDPARQALDALQSRAVRLVPVATLVVEVLPPNYSFRHPTSTPTKIVMIRARHSLSTGGALRPLLVKWFSTNTPGSAPSGASIVIVYNATLEIIRGSVAIGRLQPGKSLAVMSQSQHEGLRICSTLEKKNKTATNCLTPPEFGNPIHSLGLLNKLVRRKTTSSPSSTSRVEEAAPVARVTSSPPPVPSSGETSPRQQQDVLSNTTKKRLSIFKNKSKEASIEKPPSSASTPRTAMQPRPATFSASISVEAPVSLKPTTNTACVPSAATSTKQNGTFTSQNSEPLTESAPGLPRIFSTKVCQADGSEGSTEREPIASSPSSMTGGWQPAAYV